MSCTVAPLAAYVFAEWQHHIGRQDAVAAENDRHIVQRRVRVEYIQQERYAQAPVDNHAAVGIFLKPNLALQHHQRADALLRELLSRPRDAVDGLDQFRAIGAPKRAAKQIVGAPQALERAPQFWLEQHG